MKILKKIFNKLKMAEIKKIDLTQLKFDNVKCEDLELGDSTNTFRNKRFVLNGKKEVFKTYDGDFGKNIKQFRKNSEIICYLIGKQIGVKCAKVLPAKYGDYDGTISEVSLKKNDILIDGVELLSNFVQDENKITLETYNNYFEFIKKLKHYKINTNKLIFDLYKMCVFDFLTLQQDRHSRNIHFVKKVSNNKVSIFVYPLIDTEYAFAGFSYGRMLKENEVPSIRDNCFEADGSRLSISSSNINRYGFIYSETKEIKDIVDFAYTNVEYLDFLKDALKSFNIREILNNLKNQGFAISNEEETWRIAICDKQKSELQNELERQQNIDFDVEIKNALDNFSRGRRM